MRRFLSGLARALVALAVIVVLLGGAAVGFVYSPFFRFPTHGDYPDPHIRELIWPTIACPSMLIPGGEMVMEVDLREGKESGPQPEAVAGWRAWVTPSREELAGLSYGLDLVGSRTGPSERWPEGSREGRSGEVWHVAFRVPGEVPPELYDLHLEVEVRGEKVQDRQPHSLAVCDDSDNHFTFITLADIHVHERNNSAPASRQSDKGISGDGEPLFLDRVIEQVNLIRPDFVLMLGDYVRGQRRPGELASEYAKFYSRLLDLEIPAFLVPGNHDKYINGIDGARYFEENLGPLFYSFDVGDCHFTCLDSYQWPSDDRVVMNKLLYMDPKKWKGQVLEAEDELDPSTYRGQLAWVESDLAAHAGATLRVMAMHHDPYTDDGEGTAYKTDRILGLALPGGGGKGRHALMDLASRHGVHAVFGGHLHKDKIGSLPWREGGGETIYSCQTCVYFGKGGMDRSYPGYRLVRVEGGKIKDLAYLDGVHSYPFYDGSLPGGETDIDRLERPALEAETAEVSESGTWGLRCEVRSYLRVGMTVSGLAVPAPQRAREDYRVEGGEIYRILPMPSRPGWVMLYLRATLGEGVPGEATNLPGRPFTARISVR